MTLREQLLRDEGCRLKPYRDTAGKLTIGTSYVRPALTLDDEDDARLANPEPVGDLLIRPQPWNVEPSDGSNIFFRKLSDTSTSFAFRSLLKAIGVCVVHLLRHRSEFEVREYVTGLDTVSMIHGQISWNWPSERFPQESMNGTLLGVTAAPTRKADTQVTAIGMGLKQSVSSTPEATPSPDFSIAAHFVEVFVTEDWSPSSHAN